MSKDFNDESAALEATVMEYMTAFMRGDVPAVLATYAEDGVLMAPIGPAVEGKKQLAEVYPGLFAAVDFNLVPKVRKSFRRAPTGALFAPQPRALKPTRRTATPSLPDIWSYSCSANRKLAHGRSPDITPRRSAPRHRRRLNENPARPRFKLFS